MAGFVVVSAPRAVRETWYHLSEIWNLRGENIADARRRAYGSAYWNGIEALRDAITKDGAYFMAVETEGDGKDCWVRFDLAPRRPWLVEKFVDGMRVRFVPVRPAGGPEYVVAVRGAGRPPALLDPGAFWKGAPVPDLACGGKKIAASTEEPAEPAPIRGKVTAATAVSVLGSPRP